MPAGEKLTDFTSIFSPYDFKKNDKTIWVISKMDESNIKNTDRTNLTDQTKFRLSEISKIENYFHEGINQRKTSSM